MSTEEIIIRLFCMVDDRLGDVKKRSDASLYASEIVVAFHTYWHGLPHFSALCQTYWQHYIIHIGNAQTYYHTYWLSLAIRFHGFTNPYLLLHINHYCLSMLCLHNDLLHTCVCYDTGPHLVTRNS